MVGIDTDVLLLAFRFHRDPRQEANTEFLRVVKPLGIAAPVFVVMELLGQLSFNISGERLRQWPSWLQDNLGLTVVYPSATGLGALEFFLRELVTRPLERMSKKPWPYMDCLVLNLLESAPGVDAFVTWNARHFRGQTRLAVYTPAEYIEGKAK